MKCHSKTIFVSIFLFYYVIFKECSGSFHPCNWAFVVNDSQSMEVAHCIAVSKP